ncbi:peptidase U61 LD-carboxypeptidase A [Halothece sp. PCC 7418]|uniref:S66 peptidase family protein n=1 Tax=Halothece sp. (strain PCC 7418) TaxID=65093 RepID=UPI0002A0851B|nr:LD-carboxypeptidase [Halothece sp. PCC 7418]AFZ42934.1 peptidase U61 LD-carboxypeptidase A [Halothece sp. PCC 7418]
MLLSPPCLQPNDTVAVISPSGALKEKEQFEKGLAIWRSRYHVELISPHERNSYLAGSDEHRRYTLHEAWTNPDYKAILCSRGGYGSMRLLEQWSWEMSVTPKWLIGFSDVTALLWSLYQQGIMGLHGPVLTTLGEEPHWSIERLFGYLEGQELPPLKGKGWGGGRVSGRLLPANLTVATHLLGTPLQPCLEGVILALEDVTEAPYRIDRMLTQWRLSGVLDKIGGLALGRFSRCQAPAETVSWSVEEVLRDRAADLNCPIVSNLPFGHDGANAALPVGEVMLLDGDRGDMKMGG